ncbi:MAG: accessory gene regulator B family protein [Bacilli bacterium]|nr:accessory gene regulator B family protein [Bacilli bacterium]
MKKWFLDKSINFITKYKKYSKKDIEKLKYGLEGLYLTVTKTIVIILLAILLGILKEVIIVIILFNIIRYTGFGFHAEKSYQCLISSIINFICIPLLFLKINISFELKIIISIICIFNYLLFAPADTIKRPLPNKRKRVIRKILTTLIGIIFTILIIVFKNNYLTSLILSSLIIEVIVINPLTYRLFGQPYNNYKNLNTA